MPRIPARIGPHYFIEIVFLFTNSCMFISLLPSHIEIYTTESVQNLKKVSKYIQYFVGIAIFLIILDIILNYFFFKKNIFLFPTLLYGFSLPYFCHIPAAILTSFTLLPQFCPLLYQSHQSHQCAPV